MTEIFSWIALLIGGYTAVNTLYLFVWSVAGLFGRADDVRTPVGTDDAESFGKQNAFRRILVLIPAYKEDAVIIDSVRANLKQDYPSHLYHLAVIADSFRADTIHQLSHLPVTVVEVSWLTSTVSKALKAGLTFFPDNAYDVVVVADADNHMAPDFLKRVNAAFNAGWRAVQGHRVAKNMNTSVAILDAISEEINNHLFRKGHRALGFSSALIGSGMAFDFGLLRKHLLPINTIGGYDKELEMRLLLDRVRIGYLEDAYIFDEKVQTPFMFQHQRTRWVEAQINQAQLHLRQGIRQLFNRNIDYAEKVFQTLMLPRILLLGMLIIGFAGSLLLNSGWFAEFLGGQLLVLVITLVITLPAYLRRFIGVEVLLMIPVLFIHFSRSVFNFRRARKQFLHTSHGNGSESVI
jgi:cellulose synthase/poly-beta-1,6-N-acetylglucosamine synthase-like glycosyltransferase